MAFRKIFISNFSTQTYVSYVMRTKFCFQVINILKAHQLLQIELVFCANIYSIIFVELMFCESIALLLAVRVATPVPEATGATTCATQMLSVHT